MYRIILNICLGLLPLAALMHVRVAHAQKLYLHDAKITVASGTTLTIDGNVENVGTIENDGHLKVSGQWVNAGVYDVVEGDISFNGRSSTLPQIIHHNGQTFRKVTITGGTRKVLLSDMVVDEEFNFIDGIVEAAGNSRIIFESGVAIHGASDSSHVHGVVFHRGNGYKLFPLGDGSRYLPVKLPDVKDASATIGIRALEFGTAPPSLPETLESISGERYWHVSVSPGSVPNSPIALPIDDLSTSEPERLVVVQSASMTQGFASIGRLEYQGTAEEDASITSEFNVSLPFVALATTAAASEIIVYNAVSNNGDNLNDFLRIDNIENYQPNRFTVFNRWGDKVFEIENYDNANNVFRGRRNIHNNSLLVSGTYFYVLNLSGGKTLRGFISVKN